MDDVARQTLVGIVTEFGPSIADDPRRCEGLLRDYCSGARQEINVLVSAAKEKVVSDLLTGTDVPYAIRIDRAVKKLHDNTGIAESLARWGVESWMLALGTAALSAPAQQGVQPYPQPHPTTPKPQPPRRGFRHLVIYILLVSLIATALVAIFAVVRAHVPPTPPPAPKMTTVLGKLVGLDKDKLTVSVDDKEKTFTIPGDAEILIDDKDEKLANVKKDSTITVTSKNDVIVTVEAKSPTPPHAPPVPPAEEPVPMPPKPKESEWLPPEEAARRIGEECKVEMVVCQTYKSKDLRHVFLISKSDSDLPGNLTVVIFASVRPDVQAMTGADDLATYFRGRMIRVTGQVQPYKGGAEIIINSATQLQVVDGKR